MRRRRRAVRGRIEIYPGYPVVRCPVSDRLLCWPRPAPPCSTFCGVGDALIWWYIWKNRGLAWDVALELLGAEDNCEECIGAEDLVQDGLQVMRRAYDTYRPDLGYRFSTYTRRALVMTLSRILSESGTVRIPVHARRLTRRIEDAGALSAPEAEVAAETGATVEMVRAVRLAPTAPVSIDGCTRAGRAQADLIAGDEPDHDQRMDDDRRTKALLAAIELLPELDQKILRYRYGLSCRRRTLSQVSALVGLSMEWVRQREAEALELLREMLIEPGIEIPSRGEGQIGR